MHRRSLALLGVLLIFSGITHAADEPRFTAALDTDYHGQHPDLFTQEMDRVRLLVRQAQLEISSELGLIQYQEGFRCPLNVRFDDTPAPGVEHAIAYVQIVPSSTNEFAQQLVINLNVWPSEGTDFDKVFYHEMTHAVLNDAVVSRTHALLPSWVQEGLAVYIAGDGERWVSTMAHQVHASQVDLLMHELDRPQRAPDYAQDYLAFKYMKDQYSINALQAFVRELTQGKSVTEALEDSTGVTWDRFTKDLRAYTRKTYLPLTVPG